MLPFTHLWDIRVKIPCGESNLLFELSWEKWVKDTSLDAVSLLIVLIFMGMCRIIKEIIRGWEKKERERQTEREELAQSDSNTRSQIALRICSHLGCNVQSHARRIARVLSGEDDAVGRKAWPPVWAGAERSSWSVYTLSLAKNSIIGLENVNYNPPKTNKKPNPLGTRKLWFEMQCKPKLHRIKKLFKNDLCGTKIRN